MEICTTWRRTHRFLCNNFSRSSRFSAFVKSSCKKIVSFFTGLTNVYSFSRFLYRFLIRSNKCSISKTHEENQVARFSMPGGLLLGLTFSSSLRMLGL